MVAISSMNSQYAPSIVKPEFAVVFYQDGSSNNVVCATRHKINPDTNSLSIGTIVSPSQIIKCFAKLNVAKYEREINCIPQSVLFESDELIVWHTKRFVGEMWFRHGKKPECLTVEWPPLLFAASKTTQSMHVFALSSNSRPTMDTRLLNAPLMNINSRGLLCQGTASLPAVITTDSIEECEATLFDSQFTHVNHESTFRHKTNDQKHFRFWKSHAQTRARSAKRLAGSSMSNADITLRDFIQGHSHA